MYVTWKRSWVFYVIASLQFYFDKPGRDHRLCQYKSKLLKKPCNVCSNCQKNPNSETNTFYSKKILTVKLAHILFLWKCNIHNEVSGEFGIFAYL